MTTGPTAEVHARKVLSILRERNVGAGGFQMLKLIEEAFIESGGGLDDCVECGVEKGWFDLSGVELKASTMATFIMLTHLSHQALRSQARWKTSATR
jgi:hypothetical protein